MSTRGEEEEEEGEKNLSKGKENWTVNKNHFLWGRGARKWQGQQRRRCVCFLWIYYRQRQRGHDLYSSPRRPGFMHRYDFMKVHAFTCACVIRSILQDD